MAHVHDRAIADAEVKLVALLTEAKQTPGLFPRVEAWVARMTGNRKLSDYLHDETVKGADRVLVAKSLVEILLKPDHSRLPVVEAGEKLNGAAMPVVAPEPKADEPPTPAPDELRAMIRRECRLELADTLERVAKILRETA